MLGIGLEEFVVVVALIVAFAAPKKIHEVAKIEVKAKPSLQKYLKTSSKKG